ncbi:MAG: hypothetical protein EA424_15925 [Planctomycetaceae bacterium]|nr:MAG: hypothetical protein EA424_15925 [Planctomycetaceae bacterium]
MDRNYRSTIVCHLSIWLLLMLGLQAFATETDPSLRLVVGGRLQRVSENGRVQYRLVDQQDKATYELSARGPLELANFLGEQVEVVGTLHARGPGELREIRAARVTRTDRVVPAHFVRGSADPPESPFRQVADQQNSERRPSPLQPIPLDAPPPDFPDLPAFTDSPELPELSETFNAPETSDWSDSSELPPLTDPLINDSGSVLLQNPREPRAWEDYDVYQPPPANSGACGPQHWIWGKSELLYWTRTSTRIPALATTSDPGTPQQDAGVLGLPTTTVLFGDERILGSTTDGFRWVTGAWFEPSRRLGLQFETIGLSDVDLHFRGESNGVDILARPFTNVDPALGPAQGPDSELISFPNVTAGSLTIDGRNRFRSYGLVLRGNIRFNNGCFYEPGRSCVGNPSGYRLDLLGGYRYLSLRDDLAIRSLTAVSVTPQAGFDVLDEFQSSNNFQGGELGLLYQYYRNRWAFDGDLRLALGRTEQSVAIAGSTDFSMVGVENAFDGGLLALPTNAGTYSRKETDLITEFGLTVGYLLTSNLKITGGYRFVYWPRVVRVGDAIDLTVNGSYIPDPMGTPAGPLEPSFAFKSTSFWTQGISLGLDYRW